MEKERGITITNVDKSTDKNGVSHSVTKRKYWYRDDIEVCVLCGKETHNKERVYNESEKGTFWKEGACWEHF